MVIQSDTKESDFGKDRENRKAQINMAIKAIEISFSLRGVQGVLQNLFGGWRNFFQADPDFSFLPGTIKTFFGQKLRKKRLFGWRAEKLFDFFVLVILASL